ncbi:MAG: DUF1573 domain-containing protein, partial [Bacteroidetes bacterium]|nr:DUF1573 domain-containing protein [Bacteroidota bacterium]
KEGEVPAIAKLESQLIKDTTSIEFVDSITFLFDTINEGDKVEHTFHIKNSGDKNLIIAQAVGSCGCTVPEYPKEPVAPGAIVPIKVTFNSAGKQHEQNKIVTLTCNTANRYEKLYVKGYVRPKE